MEYAPFSRYPRLVRDLAGKLNKQVELTLQGSSTELDKSLIERIIDPLTHLVRKQPRSRYRRAGHSGIAAGKSAVGNGAVGRTPGWQHLWLEVIDDGAGLKPGRKFRQGRRKGWR